MSYKAPYGDVGRFPYPSNNIMEKHLLQHDWVVSEFGLWQHPDHKEYGFGWYHLKDAYRQQLDYTRRK